MTTILRRLAAAAPAGIALLALLVTGAVLPGCSGEQGGGDEKVKIGFLVKQPDEPWFQNEWKFAQQCADLRGFKQVQDSLHHDGRGGRCGDKRDCGKPQGTQPRQVSAGIS